MASVTTASPWLHHCNFTYLLVSSVVTGSFREFRFRFLTVATPWVRYVSRLIGTVRLSFTLTGQRISVIPKHCGLNLLMAAFLSGTIDLKTDNLDRVSIPRKIVAIFDDEHPIHGKTYGPKWWTQIGKYWQNIHCSTCLLLKFDC